MVENSFRVKAYLKVFHKIETGTKIGDCDLGFENNRYFLSKTISCNSREEAEEKGRRRINQVLSTLCLHTGVSYRIDSYAVDQISGDEPHLHTLNLLIKSLNLLPIRDGIIAKAEETLTVLDKLPNEEPAEIIEKAMNYFLRACYLETEWRSESFLNFYKVTELLAQAYRKEFSQAFNEKLKNTLFELSKDEIHTLATQTRIMCFMCEQLGVSDEKVSRIVKLRAIFSAHATMHEPSVSVEDFNSCKILSSNSLINYIKKHQ